jgi:outer membrane protein assembly factor BamB
MRKWALAGALVLTLAACGGGGGGGGIIIPPPIITPTSAPVDDWSTYAHDQQRTGFEQQTTGITTSTVSQLSLVWTQGIDAACGQKGTIAVDYASPLVVKGIVYVVSMCGNAYALDASNGSIKWGPVNVTTQSGQQCTFNGSTPGCVRGTPVIDSGKLIIPVYGFQPGTCTYNDNTLTDPCTPSNGYQQGGQLVALDTNTGNVLWATKPLAAGVFRGEPLVLNGVVYEGVAGADMASGCVQGGMVAFDESSGAQEPQIYHTTTAQNDGGSMWSAMSTDGTNIYAGTGNTCSGPNSSLETAGGVVDNEDSVVELAPATLTTTWGIPDLANFLLNNDVGSGELLWHGNLYFNGKNAILYAYDLSTQRMEWMAQMSSPNGYGGYATPTTDGNAIVLTSGFTTPSTSTLEAYSPASGQLLWSIPSHTGAIYGYAAFVQGVAFTPVDEYVYALDSTTGAVLWESPQTADYFYSSPAVVPSGLYVVDASGNVYCYKVPGSYSGTGMRAKRAMANGRTVQYLRPLQHFIHHGVVWNRG